MKEASSGACMAVRALQSVEAQVRRVRRRLLARTLLRTLLWSVGGGLSVLGLWFLMQPVVWPEPGAAVPWAGAAGPLGSAPLLALIGGACLPPTSLEAALSP